MLNAKLGDRHRTIRLRKKNKQKKNMRSTNANMRMGQMVRETDRVMPVSSVREGQFSLHGGQDIHEVRKMYSYMLYNEMGMSERK
jgi:hypothetical protein